MVTIRSLVLFASIVALGCAPATLHAQSPARPAADAPARSDRALVFVLTTGLDAQTMSSVFRHARTAAEQQRLSEVVVLVYGRGVQAFDGTISARPAQLTELIRSAMAAGVRVRLCASALVHMGVDRDRLDPQPTEIVPNAIATLVDYVARDAAIVRY
ncbi:DsrE family protein [Sandaracinus amylolyticus]|uniref:DsrE family protein n=1 Tax=Sandaracinus amylolyticus TaxID=927083 RepID=UPI001F25A794|nr:DsrE family protein [Sandaracinus amylolyticus]UJR82985.1 Hypothetical protein I5071_50500 [Sandaracinus amylolyticus]